MLAFLVEVKSSTFIFYADLQGINLLCNIEHKDACMSVMYSNLLCFTALYATNSNAAFKCPEVRL